jgi:large subunit ribosomal protein L15
MLERLRIRAGSRRPRKRMGRGIGSGHGKTCGRGGKGATARSGSRHRPWIEGGQNPLARRLPKVGFHSPFRDPPAIVHVDQLARFKKGDVVDVDSLRAAGLLRRRARTVKLLARGEVKEALTVRVHAISEAARQKLEAAGGAVELLPTGPRGPKRRRGKTP